MKYSLNLLIALLVPLLCEGATVQLTMPSYMGMNSRGMRVTCAFTANKQLTKMSLLHGDAVNVVSYQITGSKFEIVPNNKITLEVSSGTSVKGGSLIFVFSRISCSDFTWYTCKGDGDYTTLNSDNKTLQVFPVVDSILKTSRSDITVNQMSTFACRGTISKGGPYSVQWYLRTITPSSHLRAEQAKVIGQNQCSRSVSSSLTYNIIETKGLTLILWCRIESGRTVDRMGNFTIQEMSTTAAIPEMSTTAAIPEMSTTAATLSTQPVKGAGCDLKERTFLVLMVSFIACALHLF